VASLVELASVRLHFGFGEFANRALEESLFFAEFQIHCVAPRWRELRRFASPAACFNDAPFG
jgi:hypothetical protein